MTVRNHTRVICIVHSHIKRSNNGVIDLSRDIVTFKTSKSIKGTGGMSCTMMPRRNYLNLLFPDDVINLYVDTGEGNGFVRLFFGYIDRVDRTEQVGDNGQMNTAFALSCTDFMKAVDKTEVVFNPHLANRGEFTNNDLGLSQLGGGHALRTKGITAHGTPAQFVENILELLLGFGSQWKLPTSYPTSTFLQPSRNARRQRAIARLPKQVQTTLMSQFGIDVNDIGLNSDIQQQLLDKQASLNSSFDVATENDANGFSSVSSYFAQQAALSEVLTASVDLQAYQMALQTTSSSAPASILDILSLDFIEALSIDGFIASSSVWTGEGTLASLIYGWTNEIVNELCFDLRPVAVNAPDQCFGTDYSRDPDDLGVNTNGTNFMPATAQAVQYVPAVIMREYPYSTVEGLDLTNYFIMGASAGFQPFGPIFSQGAGVAGRKVYNYQSAGIDSLTPEKCYYDASGRPYKHLDVVTIVDQDVTGSTVGRSDTDIINFFDITSSDGIGILWNFILNDIMPVITPISIERHGLRRQSLWTKFANYARDQLCDGSSSVDSGVVRRNLVRWALLCDHWFQHNVEYMSGSINMRGRPDIRVGYRLDWLGRNESYYVEHVQNDWQYPKAMTTSVQVSRGQRNDNFPAYIPPILSKIGDALAGQPTADQPLTETDAQTLARAQSDRLAVQGGGNRFSDSRLAEFFYVRDTRATAYSVGGEANYSGANDIDDPENINGPAEFAGTSAYRDANTPSTSIADLDTNTFGPTVFDGEPTDDPEGND